MRISDWSSDVCSSDLHLFAKLPLEIAVARRQQPRPRRRALGRGGQARIAKGDVEGQHRRIVGGQRTGGAEGHVEIGRASCRERVCQYVSIQVVAASLKKK